MRFAYRRRLIDDFLIGILCNFIVFPLKDNLIIYFDSHSKFRQADIVPDPYHRHQHPGPSCKIFPAQVYIVRLQSLGKTWNPSAPELDAERFAKRYFPYRELRILAECFLFHRKVPLSHINASRYFL